MVMGSDEALLDRECVLSFLSYVIDICDSWWYLEIGVAHVALQIIRELFKHSTVTVLLTGEVIQHGQV